MEEKNNIEVVVCPTCGGTGRVEEYDANLSTRVYRCHTCNGGEIVMKYKHPVTGHIKYREV